VDIEVRSDQLWEMRVERGGGVTRGLQQPAVRLLEKTEKVQKLTFFLRFGDKVQRDSPAALEPLLISYRGDHEFFVHSCIVLPLSCSYCTLKRGGRGFKVKKVSSPNLVTKG
jgi:hypothetical protein